MSARERDPDRGYIDWQPTAPVAARLAEVERVLADYRDQLPLTLRQLFYVLVARLVIEKTQAEYRKLGYLLRKARRARLVPLRGDPRPGQRPAAPSARLVGFGRPRPLGAACGRRVRP